MQNNKSNAMVIVLLVVIVALLVIMMFTQKHSVPPVVDQPIQTQPTQTTDNNPPTQDVQFSFKPITTKYISYQTLPAVTNLVSPYDCSAPITDENGATYKAVQRVIGGKNFCVQTTGDAAMSHQYTTAIYTTGNIQVKFTLVQVSCAVYDNPKMTECTNERSAFSMDKLVLDAMN